MNHLYYIKPETPHKKWTDAGYNVGAVIAESESAAIERGNKSFGQECKIVSGPHKLSKDWG